MLQMIRIKDTRKEEDVASQSNAWEEVWKAPKATGKAGNETEPKGLPRERQKYHHISIFPINLNHILK